VTTISIADFLVDPNLLGEHFSGASWATWHAVLKAANAEPLNETELGIFHTVAGNREPPRHRVRELVVIAGRRSGKDSVASAIATAAAVTDYSKYLRPGERASVLCLAVDRSQARIVNRYIRGYFNKIPLLQPLVERESDDGLELSNGVEVVVATNSYRAVRGRTIACAIFDEAAFWRSEESVNPDFETYNAVMSGMVTLPDAMLVIITTAYRKAGLAYNKWQRHFAKNDDDVLVVYGPSTAFNPLLPQRIIDDALATDPEAAAAEWLSEWRSDLADYLPRELIDAATDFGTVVRPRHPAARYQAFADPGGGTGQDSFTLAIAHAEGDNVILDNLYEKRPPYNPAIVVGEIAQLLRDYGLTSATGDRYAAGWTLEGFAKEGIAYNHSERDRSAIYLDALPLFTSARARILDNQRLAHQLASLERRTTPRGKDLINHSPGAHDDCANAVCGALVLAADLSAPALWRPSDLLHADRPCPWPIRCRLTFVTAAIDPSGVFTCYWSVGGELFGGPAVLLIDYERSELTALTHLQIGHRLAELAAQAGVEPGFVMVTPPLAPHFPSSPPMAVRQAVRILQPAAREATTLAILAQFGSGQVKISTLADATARHLPLPFSAVDTPQSAAADAVLLGIASALPRAQQPREWSAAV
jgi:hypothetical protein